MSRFFYWGLAVLMASSVFCGSASAQTEEMAVADKVSSLEEQLSSANYDERDEAEKEIIKLGSQALDYIGDPSEDFEEDLNVRLKRIRKQLEKVAIEEAITPSKISLSGEMSVKEAIGEIKAQTGNTISLAEGYDPAYLDKKITLELKDVSFWTAFSEVLSKGGLASNVYGGEAPGKAIVIPAGEVAVAAPDQAVAKAEPPLDESSIFRIRVTNVSSAKNLLNPQLDYTRVSLEIEWEPRLTPISVDMPMSEIKVIDTEGNELKVSDPDQVLSGTVQYGVNQLNMSITLANVDRDIKGIAQITGKLDCVLPGRREKFRFPPLGQIEGNPKISKAGITVQYMGYEKNEDLYAVGMLVSMDSTSEKFDSHLGWIYDNPLYLIDDVGKKEPSIGQQGGNVDENGVQLEYFFVEDPEEIGLLYESPGAIVPLPATFVLKNIPLP